MKFKSWDLEIFICALLLKGMKVDRNSANHLSLQLITFRIPRHFTLRIQNMKNSLVSNSTLCSLHMIMIFIPSPECTKGAAQRRFNFAVSGQKSNFTSLFILSGLFALARLLTLAAQIVHGLSRRPQTDSNMQTKRLAGAKCNQKQRKD